MKYCECEGEYVQSYMCDASTPMCMFRQKQNDPYKNNVEAPMKSQKEETPEKTFKKVESIDIPLIDEVLKNTPEHVKIEVDRQMEKANRETPEKPDFQKMGEADWKSLYECLEDEYWQSERQEHGAVYARGAERIWNDYVIQLQAERDQCKLDEQVAMTSVDLLNGRVNELEERIKELGNQL